MEPKKTKRIVVEVPPDLHTKAHIMARMNHTTLSAMVTEWLERSVGLWEDLFPPQVAPESFAQPEDEQEDE